MSIKGFTVDGQDYQYNYPNLDNIPEITPESIGAAPQDEVDALKSESYNLIDPTGITPFRETVAADLTRTGFVIRNTAEATYSRGYLYLTLKPNTDYTFSAKKHTTSGVAYVGYSEAPAEGEPFPSANISLISRTAPDDETITKTFTTTTGILVIRFYATWDTAELGKVEYSEIMVIEGTEAKPFMRHVFAQDDEARNAVNDPQTGLDQKAGILRNTASGDIVSFTPDASVKDLLGLTVAVEPVQDLHGYDNPWPAGGGKNKLKITATSSTINGITYTVNEDGTIVANGTASDVSNFVLANGIGIFNLDSELILNGSVGGFGNSVRIRFGVTNPSAVYDDFGEGVTISQIPDLSTRYAYVQITILSGTTVSNIVFKPMIRLASETDATFAPYSNICPISGWTECKVTRTGDNIAPTVGWRVGGITGSGQTASAVHYAMYSPFIPCEPNTTYYFTVTGNGFKKRLCGYETDQSNPMASTQGTVTEEKTATITTGVNDRFLRLAVESIDQTVELSFADFTPVVAGVGNTYPITFPTEAGTVYGGTLDVTTGKLTVDRANIASYNGETLPGKWVSSMDVYTAGATPTTGAQVVYELATPIVYDLTPQTIETIKGQINNVWADVGDVTVEFAEDIKTYIDNKFAELQALALENS